MREIHIYITVVYIDENITIEEMIKGNLADLLDEEKVLAHNERTNIIKAFEEKDISVFEYSGPDGHFNKINERDKKMLLLELRKKHD